MDGELFCLLCWGRPWLLFATAFMSIRRLFPYTHPLWFGQPWWVYPNFALVFIFMEFACLFIADRLPAGISVKQSVSKGNIREFTASGKR